LDAEGEAATAVQAVRDVTPRPIVAFVQPGPNIGLRALDLVAAGADALVVIAPPSGAASPTVVGPLLGPAVFPLAIQALIECRNATDVPLIALGGIMTPALARTALDCGATAIMVDAPRWGDLRAVTRIAQDLQAAT
jgi:dihydroorotate dehydrogenase (NAD+) catalytic subunit